METTIKKNIFKSADEVIRLMLESKRQSKIESIEFAKTKEFKEMVERLKSKNMQFNAL